MGRATYKGNEAKSKMKHPSDMTTPRDANSDGWDLWSVVQPATSYTTDMPLLNKILFSYAPVDFPMFDSQIYKKYNIIESTQIRISYRSNYFFNQPDPEQH